MRNVRRRSMFVLVAGVCCALASPSAHAAPPPNPRVGIMPGYPNAPACDPADKRPVRPGTPVILWGNANGGDGTAIGRPYTFTISPNPNVSVVAVAPPLNGTITNDRYVFEEVTFNLLGGSTLECVTVTLTVNFPGPVNISKSVEIAIISPSDPSSTAPLDNLDINVDIAIEDGLRYLYLTQASNGSWPATNIIEPQKTCASTGFALWAFQNRGHLRSNPQGDDIYAEFVEDGLEFIMAGAAAAGIAAANADVPRGAVANGVSDMNSNGRSIHLCPGSSLTAWYPPPIAAAAIIASLEPTYVVQTGPFAGATFQTVLEDVIDWIGTAQNSLSASGPRGGWYYQANSGASDMSINSWYYLALEGMQFIAPPCKTGGGAGGLQVPDWIKQEAEHALVYHQRNLPGPQPFGYGSIFPLQGFAEGVGTTAGGLSGLALVETVTSVPVQDIIDNELVPLNTIAAKRTAALRHIGVAWNNTIGYQLLGWANRGNYYNMWTAARALRVTAKALFLPAGQKVILAHGGVDFDWETGETFIAGVGQTNVPPPLDPREGYFPYLVRTQDTSSGPTTRGRWSTGTYLLGGEGSPSMETSLGVLVLIQSVFGPECQVACPEDIVVKCQGPQGAVVNFNVTANGCPQGTTVVCNPPSGSLFPVGTTQVQCYAQYPCGNKQSLPCCFKVTVEEPCPCLEVKDTRIVCDKTTGQYQYTFTVTNLSGVDVTRIKLLPCDMDGDLVPDFTMTPDLFNFSPPVPNGGSVPITVTITGANPNKPACFEIWAFDKEHKRCCKLKHCVDLPKCCLTIEEQKIECDPVAPGQYLWTFRVRNQAPYTIDRFFIYPPGGVTMTPTSFILPPLPTGALSAPLTVSISGAVPGTICFEVSIHWSATDECCFETVCITLPDCNPCKVEDRCELTSNIKLCREGNLLRGLIKLTICNNCSEEDAVFKWSIDGSTDPSCPIKYLNPGNFSPSSGSTPPIPRGECITIPITITTDFAQFPPGQIACYSVTVTNPGGDVFGCSGKAKSPAPNSPIKVIADPKDPIDVPKGRIAPVSFEVHNEGTTRLALTYALSTDLPGETSSGLVSLNGLPPGEPIRRTVNVDPGAVTLATVEVSFRIHSPLAFESVYFLADDGAQGFEPLAVVSVQSVAAEDCNQNGVPDDVDIFLCNSTDANGNGVPDECEGLIPLIAPGSFVRGDANTDGTIDIGDPVAILDYLFNGTAELSCADAADANDQGAIEIGDATAILGFLFWSGPEPGAPGPRDCGFDPTVDDLTCNHSSLCN